MKKYLSCVFLILFLFTACGETKPFGESTGVVTFTDGYIMDETTTTGYGLLYWDNNGATQSAASYGTTSPVTEVIQTLPSSPQISGEIRGVWLSYYEIDVTNETSTAERYRAYLERLCADFTRYGITDVFAHVRAYGDAIYKSDVYPVSEYAAGV